MFEWACHDFFIILLDMFEIAHLHLAQVQVSSGLSHPRNDKIKAEAWLEKQAQI